LWTIIFIVTLNIHIQQSEGNCECGHGSVFQEDRLSKLTDSSNKWRRLRERCVDTCSDVDS